MLQELLNPERVWLLGCVEGNPITLLLNEDFFIFDQRPSLRDECLQCFALYRGWPL